MSTCIMPFIIICKEKNRKKSEGFLYKMCMLDKEKLSYKFP